MDNNPVSVTDPLGLSPNWLEAKVTALYRPSTPYESVELSSDGHSNEASDAFKEACIQRSVEYSQATAEEDAIGGGEGPTASTTQGDASASNSSSSEVCNNDASSSGSASDVAGASDGDDGKKTPMGPFTDTEDPIVTEVESTDKEIKKTGNKGKTWDPVTDERISKIDERLQSPAINFINDVESNLGITLRVVQGYRSIQEQNDLYAQGRTKPGKKVTNAKGGQSYHNFGLAIDVVIMENGNANWNKVVNTAIVNYGKKYGFEWGGDWKSFKDYPHFEMTFGKKL